MQLIHHGTISVVLAPLALSASMAFAQPGTGDFASTPVHELKQAYLACEHAASRDRLDFGTAAVCSLIGEELLKRAFDGSFERLLAWWRDNKDAAFTPHGSGQ